MQHSLDSRIADIHGLSYLHQVIYLLVYQAHCVNTNRTDTNFSNSSNDPTIDGVFNEVRIKIYHLFDFKKLR